MDCQVPVTESKEGQRSHSDVRGGMHVPALGAGTMDRQVPGIHVEALLGVDTYSQLCGKASADAGHLTAHVAHQVHVHAVIDNEEGWRPTGQVGTGDQARILQRLQSSGDGRGDHGVNSLMHMIQDLDWTCMLQLFQGLHDELALRSRTQASRPKLLVPLPSLHALAFQDRDRMHPLIEHTRAEPVRRR